MQKKLFYLFIYLRMLFKISELQLQLQNYSNTPVIYRNLMKKIIFKNYEFKSRENVGIFFFLYDRLHFHHNKKILTILIFDIESTCKVKKITCNHYVTLKLP